MEKPPTKKVVNKKKMGLLWGIILTLAGLSFYLANHILGVVCFCVGVFLLFVGFRKN